jgi:hypothetical protein
MLSFFKYFRQKIGVLTQNKAKFDHNIGFREKRQFVRRNCDHNIDP